MTEHPFATLIRKLDAGAIPAPWEVYESDSGEWALVHRRASGMVRPVADFPGSGESGSEASDASVDLTEMLRNAAPEVAALVEAVEAYRVSVGRYDECAKAHPVGPHLAVLERQENTARGAMFAALDALARAARDATSGPADLTRIEGSPK